MVTGGDKKYLSPSRKGDGGLSSCSPVSGCHILEAHCILSPLRQSRLAPSLPLGQKPNMTHLYRNTVCYSVDISDLPVREVTRRLEEGKEVITSDTASETPRMCYAEGTWRWRPPEVLLALVVPPGWRSLDQMTVTEHPAGAEGTFTILLRDSRVSSFLQGHV